MARYGNGRDRYLGIITAMLVAGLLGCQDGPMKAGLAPTDFSNPATLHKGGKGSDETAGTSLVTVIPDAGQLKRQTSASGSTLTARISATTGGAFSNGDFAMSVPPNALSKDTKMSIRIIAGDYLLADLGPDGYFKVPVTLTISYRNASPKNVDPDRLRMKWYDTSSNKWVKVEGTVDTANQTVTAEVWHFTQYTLSTE